MAACSSSGASSAGPPPRGRGIAPVQPTPQPAAAQTTGTDELQADPLAALAPKPPPALEEPTPAEQPPEEEKPRRNFSNELVQLVGSPLDCLKARVADAAPGTLQISMSTRVMPSGAVAQSEVSAPGLEPDELACLRRRVESVHFIQPIENAPFGVSGSMQLTRGTPAQL